MNHVSFGYITEPGTLTIGNDFLNALCLGHNSKLYGIYYPSPPTRINKDYKHVTLKHDFMLTPIPPRLWAVSARLHLYLSHKVGSINKVCSFLSNKKRNISIIHAESSRSAHRYDTWNLHIAFEKLLSDDTKLNYSKNDNYYEETKAAFDELVKDIENSETLRPYLYGFKFSNQIGGHPNFALAYFANYVDRIDEIDWIAKDDKWMAKPFELTLQTNNTPPVFTGNEFANIVNELNSRIKKKEAKILPATTFSELDTRELNVRMALIPQIDSKRFFTVGIEYNRRGGKESCVGIMHSITKRLKPNYNIWHSYNYTINSTPDTDLGRFTFFIEDISNIKKRTNDPTTAETYVQEAEINLRTIAEKAKSKHIEFKVIPVTPLLNIEAIKKLFEKSSDIRNPRLFYKDLFISYSHGNQAYVEEVLIPILKDHQVQYDIDKEFLMAGAKFSDEILQRILNCREMCVILSNTSVGRVWPVTEWGAAWVLKKRIVPFVLGEEDFSIDGRLKELHYVKASVIEEVEKYAKEVVDRRYKMEAENYQSNYPNW